MKKLLTIFLTASLFFVFTYIFIKSVSAESNSDLTGNHQAYYEISSDKTSINSGEDIEVTVWVVTSGEPFNAAQTILEWSSADFAYKSASSKFSQGYFTSKFSSIYTHW